MDRIPDRYPPEQQRLLRRVRVLLLVFVAGLVLSGITAFPLAWETRILHARVAGPGSPVPQMWPSLAEWIGRVHGGLEVAYRQYPFIAYGTDWLAFAHLVIALVFIGPLRDPVRHVWIIEWGLLACALILPLALVCGPLRGIPPFWRAIDCSFGVLGAIPLWLARRATLQLAAAAAGQPRRLGAPGLSGAPGSPGGPGPSGQSDPSGLSDLSDVPDGPCKTATPPGVPR